MKVEEPLSADYFFRRTIALADEEFQRLNREEFVEKLDACLAQVRADFLLRFRQWEKR